MQVVHKVLKGMLVFCLSLVMIVGSAQAAECYVEPRFILLAEGSSQYILDVIDGPASSLDVSFISFEEDQQTISLIVDPSGSDDCVKNLAVPGYNSDQPTFYYNLCEGVEPFYQVIVRDALPWDIYMDVEGCHKA
ncbi:hypothetical protein BJP36_24525 [Moorena producens JHB]|uniref:Uncharacterized protein n=1 Tax=Moorena producens (strain JHB) TaxID=1454205 RepID=A0A1D9G4X9_MOOP1|nr:hypothetical protein [Moorena producens]AOY82611.1 hypothetical protein BJP36_24525 [Moorena producens JHB]